MATSDLCDRALTLRRVESASAATTVRHVDQLDEETLDAVYDALEGERPLLAAEVDLQAGEVIVCTDYVRVERA